MTALGVLLVIAALGAVAYFATRPTSPGSLLPPPVPVEAGGGYDRTATDAALVMSGAGDLLAGLGSAIGSVVGSLGSVANNAAGGAGTKGNA